MSKKLSLKKKRPAQAESDPSVDFVSERVKVREKVKDDPVFSEDVSQEIACCSDSVALITPHETDTTQPVAESTCSQNKEACPICNELVLLDVMKTHVLLCLKRYQNPKLQGVSKCDNVSSVDCAVCGKDLQLLSLVMRQAHVEKCLGNDENVRVTTGDSANCDLDPRFALTSATISKLYKKSKHLNPPTTVNQEDLHLGKALSLSLSNTEAWGSLKPCKKANVQSKRVKLARKGFQVAPTLLMRTQEERNKLINEQVADVISNNQDFHVYESDLKLTPEDWKTVPIVPSFKEEFMKRHPDIVVKDGSKLWNLATLGDVNSVELDDYYVPHLRWAITPCKTATVKFKHLSQIPGRRIDRDVIASSYSSQDMGKNDNASTQAVLETLGNRNSLLPGLQSNVECCDELEFGNGGFCTQDDNVLAGQCEHTKLVKDLEHVFLNGQFADVDIFTANGDKLPCHKMIIFARCPDLIKEIIEDELPASVRNNNCMIMWKSVSFIAAKDFMRYIYTSEIQTERLTKEIAKLATKYNMVELEELCNMYLGSENESDNENDSYSKSPMIEVISDDNLQTCSSAEELCVVPSSQLAIQRKSLELKSDDDCVRDHEPQIRILETQRFNTDLRNTSPTVTVCKSDADYSDFSDLEEDGGRSPDLFEPCSPEIDSENVLSSDTPCSSRLKSRKRRADSKYKECSIVSTPLEEIYKLSSSESKGKRQKIVSEAENNIIVILDVQQKMERNMDDDAKQSCGVSMLMNDTLENLDFNRYDVWDGFDDHGFEEDYPIMHEVPKCDIPKEKVSLEDDEEMRSQCSSPAVLVLVNDTDTSEERESTPKHACNLVKEPMPDLAQRTVVDAVTPMPDYSDMDTPALKVNLKKYGLRGQKRKRAVRLLKHIYDKTHPVVPESDEDEECHPIDVDEQRFVVADTAISQEPQPLNCSQESSASSCWSSSVEVPEESLLNISTDDDDDGDGGSCKAKMDPSNLANILRKFFKRDNELYREILLYNPISIDYIQGLLKAAHIKIETKALIDFLDEENIIFKMPRKARKPGRQKRKCSIRKQK